MNFFTTALFFTAFTISSAFAIDSSEIYKIRVCENIASIVPNEMTPGEGVPISDCVKHFDFDVIRETEDKKSYYFEVTSGYFIDDMIVFCVTKIAKKGYEDPDFESFCEIE